MTLVVLHPIRPGPHRLEFRVSFANPDGAHGVMVQNIAYEMVAEGPGSSLTQG